MGEPRLAITPMGAAKRDGDGWRTTWRIANAEAEAVRVVAAIAPHWQFRGETTLDRDVRGNASTQFSLVVRTMGGAGGEIENAFVIVQIQRGEDAGVCSRDCVSRSATKASPGRGSRASRRSASASRASSRVRAWTWPI